MYAGLRAWGRNSSVLLYQRRRDRGSSGWGPLADLQIILSYILQSTNLAYYYSISVRQADHHDNDSRYAANEVRAPESSQSICFIHMIIPSIHVYAVEPSGHGGVAWGKSAILPYFNSISSAGE